MRTIRLDMCYDGTRYRGWQRLPGVEQTIQGKLETALSRILEEPIQVSASGRTDAGVHAQHQVVSFSCENPMSCEALLRQLRKYLPEDLGILDCRVAADRFHARLNAKSKTYLYRLWNSEEPCVFQRRFVTVFPEPLDDEIMRQAAAFLLGEHDFSPFCSNKHMKKSTVRRMDSIEIRRVGNEVQFLFTGNGFLYNMVRIIVGTLIEVGQGIRTPESVQQLFGQNRSEAGFLAPPQGLCLVEVQY